MNNLFDEILMTTAEMAEVDVSSIQLNAGCVKRWQSIAEFWVSKPNVFEDVIYRAMMNIIKGKHPKDDDKIDKLLELVQQALTSERNILKDWRKLNEFNVATRRMNEHYIKQGNVSCKSMLTLISNWLEYNIFYREALKTWDTTGASNAEKDRVRGMKRVNVFCDRFRQIIKFFIPNTDEWTLDEWFSQTHIFAAFKNMHDIDYSKNTADFDNLIDMMCKRLKGEKYIHKLFSIMNITDSMANLLWPVDMEKELVRCLEHLLEDNSNAYGIYYLTNADIAKSWVFRKLCQLREQKHPAISLEFSKILFEIALNVYQNI